MTLASRGACPDALFGTLAATRAAAERLRLVPVARARALALALALSPIGAGPVPRGWSARLGDLAARLAACGFSGPPGVLDGPRGLGHLLLRGGPEEITLEEVERELAAQAPIDAPLVKQDLLSLPMREAREHFERAYLQQQLQLCGGKVGQLAKRVGMERTHLYRKLRSLGVDFRQSVDD